MDYSYVVRKRPLRDKEKIKKSFSLIIKISLLIIIIAFLIYLYQMLKTRITHSFPVKYIKISGCVHESSEELMKKLLKYKNVSMLHLDYKNIFKELKVYPWIKDVKISKNLPSTIVVKIIEEKPSCVINIKDKFFILTSTGKLIEDNNKKYLNDVPYIYTLNNFENISILKPLIFKINKMIDKYKLKNISEVVLTDKDIVIYTFLPKRKYVLSAEFLDENFSKIKYLNHFKFTNNLFLKEVNLKYKNRIFIKL